VKLSNVITCTSLYLYHLLFKHLYPTVNRLMPTSEITKSKYI